jgi:hypothetical protein
MTVDATMLVPVNSPRAILYPNLRSFKMALTVEATSGAPLPKAKRVTPANRSGKPISKLIISKPGEKNL